MKMLIMTSGGDPRTRQRRLRRTVRLLKDLDHEIWQGSSRDFPGQLVLVLGGDGAMLKAARQLDFPADKTFVGLNYGNMGFMMNDAKPLYAKLKQLDKLHKMRFPLLEVMIETLSGQRHRRWAINDLTLKAEGEGVAQLRVKVSGSLLVSKVSGDGLIIYTPLGSTAYNLSVDGPILYPPGSNFGITSVAQFMPLRKVRSVLEQDKEIEVTILNPNWRRVKATSDTDTVHDVVRVTARIIPNAFTLGFFEEPNFIERAREKLYVGI